MNGNATFQMASNRFASLTRLRGSILALPLKLICRQKMVLVLESLVLGSLVERYEEK
jgi:hypothetical protein